MQNYRFSVPYFGKRYQVTRYECVESGEVDHVMVEESTSGCSIKTEGEDAVLIDHLCTALSVGEISESTMEEKLNWYFKATSH